MKIMLIMAAALSLSACGVATDAVNTIPAAPVDVANKTKLDETAGRLVTVAYSAASKAAQLAIKVGAPSGMMSPATVTRINELDKRAFDLVEAVRSAYLAGNSASYVAALEEAERAIAQFLSAVKGSS